MARCFRYGLVVLAAVLYSVQVSAARQVIPEPGEVQRAWVPGAGPSAFVDSRDWNATVSTQSGLRVQVPVNGKRSYGWPKWAAGAKAAIKKSPQQAAAAAGLGVVIAAVEWVIEDGQIVKKLPPDTSLIYYTKASNGSGTKYYADTADEIKAACRTVYPPTSSNFNTSYRVFNQRQDVMCTNGCISGWCDMGLMYRFDPAPTDQKVPVTDADIDAALADVSDPVIAADSAPFIDANVPGSFDYPDGFEFTGPPSIDLPGVVTTKTDPATGNTTTTEVLPSVQFEYGTNPWSITPTDKTTKNTYENGQKTETEESVSIDPVNQGGVSVQPKPLEIPTDCDFMPTVCEFIDWVKEPFAEEEPDLSQLIEDQDFAESVTISGNATCPAPTIIDTSRGSFEFSWQPACTWAGMIKPLVIIAALIAAIYISLGVARSE